MGLHGTPVGERSNLQDWGARRGHWQDVVSLEIGNWPTYSVGASVARLLLEEMMGYRVRPLEARLSARVGIGAASFPLLEAKRVFLD